jgi:hypothetical protein
LEFFLLLDGEVFLQFYPKLLFPSFVELLEIVFANFDRLWRSVYDVA